MRVGYVLLSSVFSLLTCVRGAGEKREAKKLFVCLLLLLLLLLLLVVVMAALDGDGGGGEDRNLDGVSMERARNFSVPNIFQISVAQTVRVSSSNAYLGKQYAAA